LHLTGELHVLWPDESTLPLRAVRYAESVTVHVELRPDESGQIYPPYVSISYAVATADDYNAYENVSVSGFSLKGEFLILEEMRRNLTGQLLRVASSHDEVFLVGLEIPSLILMIFQQFTLGIYM